MAKFLLNVYSVDEILVLGREIKKLFYKIFFISY